MNLSVVGQDLTADQVDAIQTGLSVMGAADTSVIVTDTFSETVMGLTGQQSCATRRDAAVVAARTIHTG